jgi:hypothetical protein
MKVMSFMFAPPGSEYSAAQVKCLYDERLRHTHGYAVGVRNRDWLAQRLLDPPRSRGGALALVD